MPQFLVSVFNTPTTRTASPEEMAPIYAAVGAVNQAAMDAGIFVFAGGLHEPAASTVIDPSSGTPVLSPGPHLGGEEYVGGFWVIDVADEDAALDWAKRFSMACTQVLEVRPFMSEPG